MGQQLSTNTFTTAKWIVSSKSSDGTHTTIASAITSASSGDTIFIRPGTYTENITLKAGVNLTGFGSDGVISYANNASTPNVIILGTVTASYSGSVTLANLQLQTNSAAALATSGSNTSSLILNGCSVSAVNNTGMTFNAVNFSTTFYNCSFTSTSTQLLFAVTTGPIVFQSCLFDLSATSSSSTIAISTVDFDNCSMEGLSITTSSTGNVGVYNSFWMYAGQTLLTTAGTGTSSILNSYLASTSAACVSIGSGSLANITNSTISSAAANVFTGAGTLSYGGLVFTSSSGISVTTQVPYPSTIQQGGTDTSSFVAYTPVCGGTTTTGALQSVASIGTSGQVLTSNGAGALPTFQAAGSGNLVLIQSQSVSSVASVTFTTGISSTYKNYLLFISNYTPATTSTNLEMQWSVNGGSSYVATNYLSGMAIIQYNGTTFTNFNATTFSYLLDNTVTSSTGYAGTYQLASFQGSGQASMWGAANNSQLGSYWIQQGVNTSGATSAINAFKILSSSGNIATGLFTLFGILE